MRAILIDPFARTVTEIDHDNTSYRNIYPVLSHESMEVECFTVATVLPNEDSLFVDDEGLLKDCQALFLFDGVKGLCEGYPQPLAGKGLILGADEEGKSVDAKTPLADIRVQFLTPAEAYAIALIRGL